MNKDDRHWLTTLFLALLLLLGVEMLKREVRKQGGWSSISTYWR